jgi:penicillin-insensitive murein endopeptidase
MLFDVPRRPKNAVLSGVVLALSAVAGPTVAQGPVAEPARSEEDVYAAEADSLSIGHADGGRLDNPFAVTSSDVLASVRPHRYGTRELVGLLDRAAGAVARSVPGSRLAVGDLSSESGGALSPHESHQSGRDADVGYYMLDERGEPVPQALFVRVDADGNARRGDRRYRFDDARNWTLLEAFVDDPMAETQYVILAPHLRERVVAHARSIGVSEDQLRRVALVTAEMRGSESHDDHFHVRIYCSVGDRPQCLDRPPLHPWYYGTPSPDAVEAARVADVQRAAALRRQQELARRAEEELLRGEARQAALEEARERDLAREPSRQERAEQRRAARLTADERLALRELQRLEREAAELVGRGATAERGRAAELEAEERRWRAAERRRAVRLRETHRRLEADERRRAASLRALAARERRLQTRAEGQQTADRRRAEALLRRGEQLRRERERAERRRESAARMSAMQN